MHWEKSVLPAYGFIFHENDGIANVGTGMFTKDMQRLKANLNERLETFVTQNVHARTVLANARRISPVVGHPYRDDAENVTPYADNVLVVGDAAGAGHPMTGEGIGPAMISAELAARYAVEALERGDLSSTGLAGYGDLFHAEFDRLAPHRHDWHATSELSVVGQPHRQPLQPRSVLRQATGGNSCGRRLAACDAQHRDVGPRGAWVAVV